MNCPLCFKKCTVRPDEIYPDHSYIECSSINYTRINYTHYKKFVTGEWDHFDYREMVAINNYPFYFQNIKRKIHASKTEILMCNIYKHKTLINGDYRSVKILTIPKHIVVSDEESIRKSIETILTFS